MKNKDNIFKRLIMYFGGWICIALGINISKMASLGISPVSSVPRALEVWFGYSLGTMVMVLYIFLVIVQIVVMRKEFKLINILGIPIAIVFGWIVDLFGIDPNAFGHLLYGFPRPEVYPLKLVYLAASMVIIAIGVYFYIGADVIPMPSESLSIAISYKTGKPFGDCKTIVDVSLICIAVLIQLIFLGGIKSFTDTVIVREGTIISAVFIGQIVKIITKLFSKIGSGKAK